MVPRTDLNTLPVDKGWAWAVATGGFISHSLVTSSVQVRILLFLEIVQMFNTSFTTGSLVFMFTSIASSFSSVVVTNYIMPRLKERGCLIVGGMAASVLSFGAAFAPNIGVFIAILSMKGIVSGLTVVPGMALIPRYFKRFRSQASVVPYCGGSAANIIGPFVIRAVREEYGIRGCYILLSAVELHYCVAGLLLRPISAYRFGHDDAKTAVNGTSATQDPVQADSHEMVSVAVTEENLDPLLQIASQELAEDVEAAEALLNGDDVDAGLHRKNIINIEEMATENSEVVSLGGDTNGYIEIKRDDTNGDIEIKRDDTNGDIEIKRDDTDKPERNKSPSRWHTFLQSSSLKTWSYRCMLLSAIPGSASAYLLNYIPTISKFQGASFEQAALLTTIMGCVDMCSRISTGFITNSKVLPPSRLVLVVLLGLGIGCHFIRFAKSFESLIPMIIFTAIFLGSRAPLQSLLCQEVVGPKKFPQAYSLLTVVITLTSSSLNPALGTVVEATGSFVLVLHILGVCFLISAAMLACLPFFVRLDVKLGRNK